VRFSVFLLLGTLLIQTAVTPLMLVEDCPIQELRHTDDDCSPLCVTCACSPVGHAFQTETVLESGIGNNLALRSFVPAAVAPDAPTREILHVPLAVETL